MLRPDKDFSNWNVKAHRASINNPAVSVIFSLNIVSSLWVKNSCNFIEDLIIMQLHYGMWAFSIHHLAQSLDTISPHIVGVSSNYGLGKSDRSAADAGRAYISEKQTHT